MSGEAFTTHLRLLTLPLLANFVWGNLEGRNTEPVQARQEFPAAKPSQFCRFALRKDTHFVPLDCRNQTHLSHKCLGRTAQGRKYVLWQIDNHLNRHLYPPTGHRITKNVAKTRSNIAVSGI